MIPMLPLSAIIYLSIAHFIGDFILQSDYMALNKSKSNLVLSQHCLAYSIPFMVFGWQYALLNSFIHFCVDYITSRMTSYFWRREERHKFFVTIGMDQAIHMITLVSTLYILKG